MGLMRRTSLSPDDRLIARLLAPPDLRDGMESLTYWHQRRQRLSWYRFRARREAVRMSAHWERRVRSAMLSPRGASVGARAAAGVMLTSIRLRRWSRRTAVVLTVAFGISLLVAPLVGVLLLLIRSF